MASVCIDLERCTRATMRDYLRTSDPQQPPDDVVAPCADATATEPLPCLGDCPAGQSRPSAGSSGT